MAELHERRRHIAVAAGAALALVAVIGGSVAMATQDSDDSAQGRVTVGAPGRVPSERGKAADPEAPANSGPVSDEISHDSETEGKVVNITIDDGPDPVWTPKVLELLRKNGAKATFCMIGPRAKEYPDLVKKVVAEGHRLCDHSVDHNTAMDKRSEDYQKHQVLDALKMIQDAAGDGARVQYYRAPGGAFTPYSRKLAAEHGMRPLGWQVDSNDWRRPGVARIESNVKRELRNGPTILFHDGGGNRSQTMAALDETLPWLKQQGYGFSFPKI
ncbi:polysaccharide deacetylase family protein [Streptomyces orinoci]|uniref:Polysaccharide deacetylase family protein n=1 Tax=Streptomyces orinoci TaxID=67339 RepID=A0ABV3JUT0_STRON|nr:polysaccharide deacetylase family protein [Streptomyces orinoci]